MDSLVAQTIYFLSKTKMSKKLPKYDVSKKLKFDIEKGEYIERAKYIEAKKNPIAIIYVRVSDQKQVDEWNGLESQEATCRRWAEAKDIKVLKIFSDGGKSGADMSRKGLLDALEYLKKENAKYPKVAYFLWTEV